MRLLLSPLLAYLIGSISSAVVVARLMGLPDPRTTGSKNPGATNILRIGGKKAAALTLLGDVLKGVIPVLLAKMLGGGPTLVALAAMGAFLGHLFPLYTGFRGGKGVATGFGTYLALSPLVALIMVGIWLIVAKTSRYSSLGGLSAAAAAPILIAIFLKSPALIVYAVVSSALLFWRHRENIRRLLNGTESRIGD
ncbi:MAG: acyl-phosphate glycerol 3-phosphate acyltransferase [Gammaproteobacteria bacterium]|nr:MAG: acyl-phosphate glycerol 3-phosphate acyltransferase [Gammaproteobacteria bacterium]